MFGSSWVHLCQIAVVGLLPTGSAAGRYNVPTIFVRCRVLNPNYTIYVEVYTPVNYGLLLASVINGAHGAFVRSTLI